MHTLSRMESQTWYVTRLFRQYPVLILFIDTAPFGTRDWLNASLQTMEDYEHFPLVHEKAIRWIKLIELFLLLLRGNCDTDRQDEEGIIIP